MQQQQQPIAVPKPPPTIGQAILNSLLFIGGSILVLLVPLLLSPASNLFFLLVFLSLVVVYPILFGYGFFSLVRTISRVYGAITVGLISHLGALFFAYLAYRLFTSIVIPVHPAHIYTFGGGLVISLLSIEVISISFVIYGLVKICQQRYPL